MGWACKGARSRDRVSRPKGGNAKRFPEDFAFVLTKEEYEALRSQIAIIKPGRGGHWKYLPTAFTEHGVVMAASVLNSPKAVEMSVEVVRAFVRLRGFLASHHHLAAKLDELERKIATHDTHIVALFDAVRSLIVPRFRGHPGKGEYAGRSPHGQKSKTHVYEGIQG